MSLTTLSHRCILDNHLPIHQCFGFSNIAGGQLISSVTCFIGWVPWLKTLKTPFGQNAWSVLKQKYCCILRSQSHLIFNNSGIFCVLSSLFSPWDSEKKNSLPWTCFCGFESSNIGTAHGYRGESSARGPKSPWHPSSCEGFQTFRLKGNCSKVAGPSQDTYMYEKSCSSKVLVEIWCQRSLFQKQESRCSHQALSSTEELSSGMAPFMHPSRRGAILPS